MNKRKEVFGRLPTALQKQVVLRGSLGGTAVLLFIVVLAWSGELAFALPCLVLSLFLIVNSLCLLYNCVKGSYVAIQGICTEAETTVLKRRVKSIRLQVNGQVLAVSVRHRLKAPAAGDEITVYLPESAPVYEKDGGYCIYSFYAMEINRKV